LALLVTADFHVPLCHHTYLGNQPDAPTFACLTKELVKRHQLVAQGVERVAFIFDKGNNFKDNLAAVTDRPYHFIGSLVPTQHPELLAIPAKSFRSLADDRLPQVTTYRTHKEVFGLRRTIVVTHNETLFVAQSRTLLREIDKRQKQLQDRRNGRRNGEKRQEKRGRNGDMPRSFGRNRT